MTNTPSTVRAYVIESVISGIGYVRKDKLILIPFFVLGTFFFCVIFADHIAPHPYYQSDSDMILAPPGTPGYPLGGDILGRCILSRLIHGTRIVFNVITVTTIVVASIGIPTGLLAGYKGGIIDDVISRTSDILLAFPSFLLAITIIVILGRSLNNAILAVSVSQIPILVRVTRSATLSVKEATYVEISKMMGASTAHILRHHIFPGIIGAALTQITVNISLSILSVAGLSFLGLGVPPPLPEWGVMISENRIYLREAPTNLLFPGLAIFTLVIAWNELGERLRGYTKS